MSRTTMKKPWEKTQAFLNASETNLCETIWK